MKRTLVFLSILLCFNLGCSNENKEDNPAPDMKTLREHTGYLAFAYYQTNPPLDSKAELCCQSHKKQRPLNYKPFGMAAPNIQFFVSTNEFVLPFHKDERKELFYSIAKRMGETGDYDGTTEPFYFPDSPITDIDIVTNADICDGYPEGASLKNVSVLYCASAKQFVTSHYSLDNIYESTYSLLSEVQWPIEMPYSDFLIEFNDEFLEKLSSTDYPITISITYDNGGIISGYGKICK